MTINIRSPQPGDQHETGRDRSHELLLAAASQFATRGYAPVTIRDIAKHIGANTGVIYYYYSSKEGLFGAAVKYLVTVSLQQYRAAAVDCDDPKDLLIRWFDVVVNNFEIVSNLLKVMYDYTKSDLRIDGADEAIQQFYAEEREFLTSAIEEGARRKLFQDVDAGRIALFISTHLNGIIVRSTIHRDRDVILAIEELRETIWKRLECN